MIFDDGDVLPSLAARLGTARSLSSCLAWCLSDSVSVVTDSLESVLLTAGQYVSTYIALLLLHSNTTY
jgi:hypothetical protein